MNYRAIFILICLTLILLLFGCGSESKEFNEVAMGDYYDYDDFQSITIGESTYQDVCKVGIPESMQITSYGGFCEYPMQNGDYILIKFYGKDLVVGAIE